MARALITRQQASLDRSALQELGEAFASEGDSNAKFLIAAAAIRNVSFLVESDSINNFMKDELYKGAEKLKDANGFSAIKSSFIMPRLAHLLLNDELPCAIPCVPLSLWSCVSCA